MENQFIDSDDAIFHYTTSKTAIEKILLTKQLKFGCLGKTDDPYEYRSKGVSVGLPNEHSNTNISEIISKIILSETYFISFCSNKFEEERLNRKAYEKPRMWSQYGEKQKGICLAFSKSELKRLIEINNMNAEFKKCEPIGYDYDLNPEIINLEKDGLAEEELRREAIKYLEKNYKSMLFGKNRDYIDEDEFRILLISTTTPNNIDISSSLRGIIVGDLFSKAYYPILKKYQKEFKLPIHKVSWNKYQFVTNNLGNILVSQ